jgi:hypothetical protein
MNENVAIHISRDRLAAPKYLRVKVFRLMRVAENISFYCEIILRVAKRETMRMLIVILILVASFFPQHIYANDGFAALGVGGVTIAKTDKIAIKKEVLDISCGIIHVSYEFINESDNDEDALVLFPLPPYCSIRTFCEAVNCVQKDYQLNVTDRRR